MYKYEILVLAHRIKFVNHELPSVFQNHLKLTSHVHLRTKDNFQLTFFNSSIAQKQSVYQMSFHWNLLPNNLKSISSLKIFKKELRNYLLNTMDSF